VLRLEAAQVLSLWDEVLPVGARELPEDLARIDALLTGAGLLAPIRACWEAEGEVSGRSALRPSSSDDRDGHLRALDGRQAAQRVGVRDAGPGGLGRFCLIALSEQVPGRVNSAQADQALGAPRRSRSSPGW
jgi:hypothetical protein